MANKPLGQFGVPIVTETSPAEPTPGVYDSIRTMARAHLKKMAEIHGLPEAVVRDIISGKKTNLKSRKKELEEAGNE